MKVPSRNRSIASLLLLSTTTTFAVPPADYAGAGRHQGGMDATQQAKDLGRRTGLEEGKVLGARDGYAECEAQMRADARKQGERQGDRDGTLRGSDDGAARATLDGQAKGAADGAADGDARANQDAYAQATPKGTADGIAEANRTDAAVRGTADGKVAGDAAAKTAAATTEYEPARDDYRRERYAEAIRSEATINLGSASGRSNITASAAAPSSAALSALEQARLDARAMAQSAGITAELDSNTRDPKIPDVKPTQAADKAITYCRANASNSAPAPRPNISPRPGVSPRPHPSPAPSPSASPTPPPANQFEACIDAYKPAYEQAFTATFRTEYVAAYNIGFNQLYAQYKAQGCQDARRADYRRDYDASYRRSFDETYRLVFDRVYRTVFAQKYQEIFGATSARAYDQNYDAHYGTHYANAKAKAMAAQQDRNYSQAFEAAKASEYSAKYPIHAKAVIARARADEAAEFTRLPVRLIGIAMEESIRDGIQEPGEKLTVSADLRNFSDSAISARDIEIRAVAKTGGVAIPGAVAILTRDLSAKSLNHIVGALDIRLDETALGKASAVEIQISVRGNRLATETIDLTAKTLTSVELLETPVVRLGYPGAVRLRVTNRSALALPENANLGLSTNMPGVVFSKSSEAVNGLRAGEAREVTFPFQADEYTEANRVNFVASLNLASGRRIGLLNETRDVPSIQDYSFRIRNGLFDGDVSDLRKSGKTRVKVFAKNISTRNSTGTLTLTASITGPNAAIFSFVRGNQVVLDPLSPGKEANGDKIVVKSNGKNSGGTFVLEVREAGKLIGIYRENF